MTDMKDKLGAPKIVDRSTFHSELEALRVREKAHTHEGDAIAAARRRLPMVEVDPAITLIGPHGALSLLDAFEGLRQLLAYYFMWHTGHPAPEQCEGCTWVTTQVRELSYLHSRDVTFAVFCQGPYEESSRYRDFMGWDVPWYSAVGSLEKLLVGRRVGRMHIVCYLRQGDQVFETYWTTARGVEAMDNSYGLLDLTVYGRQENWEDSPLDWPQQCSITRTSDGPPNWTPVPKLAGRTPHRPMAPPERRAIRRPRHHRPLEAKQARFFVTEPACRNWPEATRQFKRPAGAASRPSTA